MIDRKFYSLASTLGAQHTTARALVAVSEVFALIARPTNETTEGGDLVGAMLDYARKIGFSVEAKRMNAGETAVILDAVTKKFASSIEHGDTYEFFIYAYRSAWDNATPAARDSALRRISMNIFVAARMPAEKNSNSASFMRDYSAYLSAKLALGDLRRAFMNAVHDICAMAREDQSAIRKVAFEARIDKIDALMASVDASIADGEAALATTTTPAVAPESVVAPTDDTHTGRLHRFFKECPDSPVEDFDAWEHKVFFRDDAIDLQISSGLGQEEFEVMEAKAAAVSEKVEEMRGQLAVISKGGPASGLDTLVFARPDIANAAIEMLEGEGDYFEQRRCKDVAEKRRADAGALLSVLARHASKRALDDILAGIDAEATSPKSCGTLSNYAGLDAGIALQQAQHRATLGLDRSYNTTTYLSCGGVLRSGSEDMPDQRLIDLPANRAMY